MMRKIPLGSTTISPERSWQFASESSVVETKAHTSSSKPITNKSKSSTQTQTATHNWLHHDTKRRGEEGLEDNK